MITRAHWGARSDSGDDMHNSRRWSVSVAAAVGALAAGGLALGTTPAISASCPSSWPMYQHDPGRTGSTRCSPLTAANVSTLAPRWFASTGDSSVTATPTVAGGLVFAGDSGGVFHALDAKNGAPQWTFDIAHNRAHADQHQTSYGAITSSAAYGVNPQTQQPAVYFGGGGSVYALDARSGQPLWATDADPAHPTSPTEVESSPLLFARSNGDQLVIVGSDDNESPGEDQTGLMALDARDGHLVWQFQPETERTVTAFDTTKSGHGCGDVWGSPALYDSGSPSTSLFVFGTGNCADPGAGEKVPSEAVWAIDAESGAFRGVFSQAGTTAGKTYGGDDDFGSSAIVSPTRIQGHPAALALNKSGTIYALRLDSQPLMQPIWSTQAAQPGQSGPAAAGAIGGFIASAAVGQAGGKPALFAASAIPLPFKGNGPTSPAGPQVDDTLTNDPGRVSSLHALDLETGKVLWHQPLELPSYAAVTYVNGVVFAPSTTSFSVQAFDSATGAPLWGLPLLSSPASGVSAAGAAVFMGAGTAENSSLGLPPSPTMPPQAQGVWSFGLAAG